MFNDGAVMGAGADDVRGAGGAPASASTCAWLGRLASAPTRPIPAHKAIRTASRTEADRRFGSKIVTRRGPHNTAARVRASHPNVTASPHRSADRSRRSGRWLGRGGGALLASAAAHAAAAVTIGGVLAAAPRFAGHEHEAQDVDVAIVMNTHADAPSPRAERAPAEPKRAPSAPRRRPAPQLATAPDDGPPRFMLSAGTVATRSEAAPSDPATGSGAPSAELAAFAEGDVNVSARLLAASPLVYPPAARKAEIEFDFPIEIVVDAAGRVVSARARLRAGYGIDESALRAIRGYRFSPALRGGRPVPVRMRWTVQFRLR
jgi:TonB family protein